MGLNCHPEFVFIFLGAYTTLAGQVEAQIYVIVVQESGGSKQQNYQDDQFCQDAIYSLKTWHQGGRCQRCWEELVTFKVSQRLQTRTEKLWTAGSDEEMQTYSPYLQHLDSWYLANYISIVFIIRNTLIEKELCVK